MPRRVSVRVIAARTRDISCAPATLTLISCFNKSSSSAIEFGACKVGDIGVQNLGVMKKNVEQSKLCNGDADGF